MNLWETIPIDQPGVLACTGAGGKTSLLQTLERHARSYHFPVILTSTTKMFYHQVEQLAPVFSDNYAEGAARIAEKLTVQSSAAWFSCRQGEKCIGLPVQWIDDVAMANPSCQLLVEADGARGCLVKAPALYEPVIPNTTTVTVGVLNLQALGQPLNEIVAHRLELVSSLLHKAPGQLIRPEDMALLALSEQGIFKNSRGRKVLLLTGSGAVSGCHVKTVIQELRHNRAGICRCVVAAGYGENMRPIEVYDL